MEKDIVTIVSGLPRSGTSMMMRMLAAGGMPVVTDNIRAADEDNPKGYYEFEKVKQIPHDKSWLVETKGKAIKMVSELLRHLPPDYNYKIIFMRRKMEEILASQRQMLIRKGKPVDTIDDEKLKDLFSRHLEEIEAWLAQQPNMAVIYVHYSEVLANPWEQATRISSFLANQLDVDKMIGVVDQTLYRQRK
ncbi:MAG: sulfotransferase [candidate division KSB1 bacterium]|nr:sulfotransferase [candidate division KSB1 bacterium]MDZ7301506.1 sulfotransferase [candidate division KSB1 bacterium]MDZ7310908.1 sulfotransferase [candidate division KSB1 bacterium]